MTYASRVVGEADSATWATGAKVPSRNRRGCGSGAFKMGFFAFFGAGCASIAFWVIA